MEKEKKDFLKVLSDLPFFILVTKFYFIILGMLLKLFFVLFRDDLIEYTIIFNKVNWKKFFEN